MKKNRSVPDPIGFHASDDSSQVDTVSYIHTKVSLFGQLILVRMSAQAVMSAIMPIQVGCEQCFAFEFIMQKLGERLP